ncbi:MAG: DUF2213 domain-containing protein [Nodosilinea sp. WJT8-NPBG4]|jgi:hypothetical protein|nr:DUF2213 domain-containing protein [Nodosilinea sp. WJT8-NPBG4]
MQFRQDSTPILKSQETSNGHLRIYGRIGRANYPLKYINQDGTSRTEIIRPEHLFSRETLDSFKMVPVTKGHPPEILNSDNTTKYLKGMTGHHMVVEDSEFLGIVATLVDRSLINSVKDGTYSQISPGYSTTLIQGDGSESDPYCQGGRIANHIAACTRGRHGPEVSFKLDSTDSELWINSDPDIYKTDFDEEYINSILNRLDSSNQTVFSKSIIDLTNQLVNIQKGKRMPTSIPIKNRVFNVDGDDSAALAASVADLQTRLDNLETELNSTKSEKTALENELVTVKTESSRKDGLLEVVEAKLSDAEKAPKFNADEQAATMAEQMSERIELWSTVLPVIRKDSDFTPDFKLDSTNIQRLYLLSQKPELAQNERFNSDSGYVAGLYTALQPSTVVTEPEKEETAERADAQENISMSLLEMINQARKDSGETVEDAAEERADSGTYGGANYASGSKEKESPIAKKRRERSMKPVREAMN